MRCKNPTAKLQEIDVFIAAENTWQGIVYNTSCPTVKFLSKSLKRYQNQEWEDS